MSKNEEADRIVFLQDNHSGLSDLELTVIETAWVGCGVVSSGNIGRLIADARARRKDIVRCEQAIYEYENGEYSEEG